jgi:SAM-dependent methyltransferase
MATPPVDADPYRAALVDALARIPVGPDWRCADIGTGTGSVSLALAALVGPAGRVWAVDHSPDTGDELAAVARETGTPQLVPLVQSAEEFALPVQVDLAWCRFLLMHVAEPFAVWRRMVAATRPGGFIVAQEPITTAGRVGGAPLSMPDARHPDIGASLPAFPAASGCALVSAWAVAPAGAGPGPVASYLAELSGVDPGDDPIVLPVLVTVIAQRPAAS